MLAHLSDALRIHTILTTNFDMLTEDAFRRLQMPLATFDVHRNAGLPDARLVLKQRAIIKINGGLYGLRADDSLYKGPAEAEKGTFCEYFGSTPRLPGGGKLQERKHLLVLGASCGEERTMGFLTFAAKQLTESRLYWVCYEPDEKRKVENAFRKVIGQEDRLRTIVHCDIGLLLFQLYQRLYHSLPPAGADYPAFYRVPPDPYPFTEEPSGPSLEKEPEDWVKEIEILITNKLDRPDSDMSRMIVIDGQKGVSSISSAVWDRLTRKYSCLWLELDDFLDPEDLFITLLAEIARSVGMPPPGPFYPSLTSDKCRDHLKQFVQDSFRKFVVFLNSRDGPGHSAGWESPEVPGVAENQQPSSRWSAGQVARFWSFLHTSEEDSGPPGIVQFSSTDVAEKKWLRDIIVVVMVQTANTPGKYIMEVPAQLQRRPQSNDYLDIPACIPFDAPKIRRDVCNWLGTSESLVSKDCHTSEQDSTPSRDRFLYGLTLFRQPRHSAALCSWGLIKATKRLSSGVDNDEARARCGRSWLDHLRDIGAIRDKPGGLSWMHRDVRDSLREELEVREPRLKGLRAECHQGIADWYVKLFRSSNDPLAALESLYHRLCCVEFADRSTADDECGDPEHIKETAFIEAITTLKLARDRIVSSGYFTASSNLLRQMAQAISRVKLPRAAELTRMCKETLRDFAREAADFRIAFHINDQLHPPILALPENPRREASCGLPRRNYLLLETKYYNAVILTGLRSYGRAENEFHDLFQQLGFPDIAPGVDLWQGYGVRDMRKMGRTWARLHKENTELLHLTIRTIRRYMFLEMLIAQAYEYLATLAFNERKRHDNVIQDPNVRKEDEESVRRRTYSEAMYVLATEIMRYVDDHGFLQTENAYLRTLYGVLMATLDRYCEAHRRLNEASGYLAHSAKRNATVTLAVADLRRAEVYLLRAEKEARATEKENQAVTKRHRKKGALACLEDAVFCLDRAQASLDENRRKDVWWWTLMYELRMRACLCLTTLTPRACELAHDSLAARFCREPPCDKQSRCAHALQDATQLIVADPFRLARLMKMFHDLGKGLGTKRQELHLKELEQLLEYLQLVKRARKDDSYGRYPLDASILQYVALVEAQLKGTKQ